MQRAPLAVRTFWTAYTLWHARHERTLPYWPEAKLRALQDRRVRAIVRHAYGTVPFYRESMDRLGVRPDEIRSADDLARLPAVTIDDYARDPERYLSSAYRDRATFPAFTSGTSGYSRAIHFDPACLFRSLAARQRRRIVVAAFTGRSVGYSEMTVATEASLANRLREFYEAHSAFPGALDLRRSHVVPFGRPEERLAELNAARPDVLRGYGSFIGLLFRWAWHHDLPIHRPKLVVYGGEGIDPQDRALIEEKFGVPVCSAYQAAEAHAIAYQCELRRGFHVETDQVAVRVVDADGRAVGPGGTGEILVSNLTNRATVLLNFRLRDTVTLAAAPCPCGRTLPLIERIVGRTDDAVVHPDGYPIHALVAVDSVRLVPEVLQLQLVQEATRRFLVRYVPNRNADSAQIERKLHEKLRRAFGDDIAAATERVELIPPEPSGKVKLVISGCRPPGLDGEDLTA